MRVRVHTQEASLEVYFRDDLTLIREEPQQVPVAELSNRTVGLYISQLNKRSTLLLEIWEVRVRVRVKARGSGLISLKQMERLAKLGKVRIEAMAAGKAACNPAIVDAGNLFSIKICFIVLYCGLV